MTRREIIALSHVQDLVGGCVGIYHNDRSSSRADKLVPMLQEAFDMLVSIIGESPYVEPRPGEAERAMAFYRRRGE